MATREYTLAVGTDLIDASGNGWQIAGITIDNPSGSWLHVGGAVNAYVPPYTLGWSASVAPTQASISVRFVDSPSGSLSELVGDPVTVRVHAFPTPSFAGTPSGSGSKQAIIPPSSRVTLPSSTDVLQTLIVNSNPGGGHRIVVRRLSVVPDLSAGLGTPQPFRSTITLEFASSGGGPLICILAISPESPFAEASFEDGFVKLNTAASLQVLGRREPDTAMGYYLCTAQYYEEIG